MKRERVTEDELRASVRQQGYGRMAQIAAVVLETDGSLSVIGQPGEGSCTALANVAEANVRPQQDAVPREGGP